MGLLQRKNQIGNIVREKLELNDSEGLMPTLKGDPIAFWLSPTGMGVETDRLPDFVLEWDHFDEIVRKANALGGKMYRGDNLVQLSGMKLGQDIPYDCMEGFIASHLLFMEDGQSVTRRSTYYSGVLAWAGIITIHKSQGKCSFSTVNAKYRNI